MGKIKFFFSKSAFIKYHFETTYSIKKHKGFSYIKNYY